MGVNLDLNFDEKLNMPIVVDEHDTDIKVFSTVAHDNDLLQTYLKEIGKVKLLKSEEEKELENQKKVEEFRAQLMAIGRRFEAKHKREQGGENLGGRKPNI